MRYQEVAIAYQKRTDHVRILGVLHSVVAAVARRARQHSKATREANLVKPRLRAIWPNYTADKKVSRPPKQGDQHVNT